MADVKHVGLKNMKLRANAAQGAACIKSSEAMPDHNGTMGYFLDHIMLLWLPITSAHLGGMYPIASLYSGD